MHEGRKDLQFFGFFVVGAAIRRFQSRWPGMETPKPLRTLFTPILAKFDPKPNGIGGIWKATFEYPTETGKDLYPEIIKLSSFLGQIVGNIVPHEDNHDRLSTVAHKKPVRLRGALRDNLFFTGTWFHPVDRQHYHGAFHLLVSMTGDEMEGTWIGYSDKKKIIEQGKWIWTRI
jgi:hypothetical protein